MDRFRTPERVVQRFPWPLAIILAGLLHASLAAQAAKPADNWKFDAVHLKDGRTFHGLVAGETETAIVFKRVLRHPGERTKIYETTFRQDEIKHIDKLVGKERELLVARVQALDPASEKQRMGNLDLKVVSWGNDPKGGLSYKSAYFVLLSNTREDIVRRAALQLEQIYAAYVDYLPPRHPAGQPTKILLVKSLAEYRQMLQKQGRHLLNPAFYDCATNEIVCASDLERLGEELDAIGKEQRVLIDRLKETKAKLLREYKGNIPKERSQEIDKAWSDINRTNYQNAQRFLKATRRLFQTLYHEAFHAYLANFVYPPAQADAPRWLNEGLAQIFETAVVDVDELLVGRPDEERLKAVKVAEHKQQLVSLRDLLLADAKSFLVAHAGDQQVSDRYYLASWALAFFLTFERKKLGTPELDEYVRALKKGADPLEAFSSLVGQPLPEFERAFHQYLRNLRGNGSTAKLAADKPAASER